MHSASDRDTLKIRRLCSCCVAELFLRNEITTTGTLDVCFYCNTTTTTYSIGELADRMQTVFEEHYSRTATEPTSFEYAMSRDEESSYQWDREGEQAVYAIMNAANIPEQAAQDIQTILEDRFSDYDAVMSGEETEFSSDSHYEEKRIDDSSWWKEWSQFERSLKT